MENLTRFPGMETSIIFNNRRKHKGKQQQRNGPTSIYPKPKFRYSLLNIPSGYQELHFTKDVVIANILQAQHIQVPPIKKHQALSNHLIQTLLKEFNLEQNRIYITDKDILIEYPLKHDFYELDATPFFKLKHKSKRLYIASLSLLNQLNFFWLENEKTPFYQSYFIDRTDLSAKELQKFNRHMHTALKHIDSVKKYSLNTTNAMHILKNYRPQNSLYQEIKHNLMKMLPYHFEFHNDTPYLERIHNHENTQTDDYCVEVFERIFLTCNNNIHFEYLVSESLQMFYENYQLHEPKIELTTTTIDEDKIKSINLFEDFILLYNQTLELLKNI